MTTHNRTVRNNQRQRTRTAIVTACRELVLSAAEITMPAVAKAALVSEATAYRYFPDLPSLLAEALEGTWPEPAVVLTPLANCTDPVERIGFATEFLLREVLARQGAVRAMVSASLLRPELAEKARPGHRFALIDAALAPLDEKRGQEGDETLLKALTALKRELAIIVGAEALFVLTDLCGLSPDDAITTAVRAAEKVTRATVCAIGERQG